MSFEVLLLLYLAGIGLILFELITPGVVMGLVGLGCLVVAVHKTFVTYGAAYGVSALLGMIAFVTAVFIFAVHRMTLQKQQDPADGFTSVDPGLDELMGTEGVTMTRLQPSGYCRLNGRRVDGISRGEPIDQDTPVRVIQIDGGRVVVRAL
jgi:membrane-bound serine protease (ClpP class)